MLLVVSSFQASATTAPTRNDSRAPAALVTPRRQGGFVQVNNAEVDGVGMHARRMQQLGTEIGQGYCREAGQTEWTFPNFIDFCGPDEHGCKLSCASGVIPAQFYSTVYSEGDTDFQCVGVHFTADHPGSYCSDQGMSRCVHILSDSGQTVASTRNPNGEYDRYTCFSLVGFFPPASPSSPPSPLPPPSAPSPPPLPPSTPPSPPPPPLAPVTAVGPGYCREAGRSDWTFRWYRDLCGPVESDCIRQCIGSRYCVAVHHATNPGAGCGALGQTRCVLIFSDTGQRAESTKPGDYNENAMYTCFDLSNFLPPASPPAPTSTPCPDCPQCGAEGLLAPGKGVYDNNGKTVSGSDARPPQNWYCFLHDCPPDQLPPPAVVAIFPCNAWLYSSSHVGGPPGPWDGGTWVCNYNDIYQEYMNEFCPGLCHQAGVADSASAAIDDEAMRGQCPNLVEPAAECNTAQFITIPWSSTQSWVSACMFFAFAPSSRWTKWDYGAEACASRPNVAGNYVSDLCGALCNQERFGGTCANIGKPPEIWGIETIEPASSAGSPAPASTPAPTSAPTATPTPIDSPLGLPCCTDRALLFGARSTCIPCNRA